MLIHLIYLFLPSSNLSAYEPMLRAFINAPDVSIFLPRIKEFSDSPLLVCVLRFCCRLGPIVPFLLMATFEGKFFLLTLSYFAKKECPLGNSMSLV